MKSDRYDALLRVQSKAVALELCCWFLLDTDILHLLKIFTSEQNDCTCSDYMVFFKIFYSFFHACAAYGNDGVA